MIIVSKLAAQASLADIRKNSDFIRTRLRDSSQKVTHKKLAALLSQALEQDPPPASPTNLKSPASQTEASTPPNPASDFSPAASGPVTPVVGEEPLELKKYKAKFEEKEGRHAV